MRIVKFYLHAPKKSQNSGKYLNFGKYLVHENFSA